MESGRPEPVLITAAPASLAEDQRRRMRNYAVQMGIRVAAFAVLVPLWGHIPVWLGFVLAIAATVLPGFAVVGANAGRERTPHSTALGVYAPQLAAKPATGPVAEPVATQAAKPATRPAAAATELGEDDE